MRTLLLVLAISSACTTTGDEGPPARRMPSASATLGGGPPERAPWCQTRYDYPGHDLHLTCQTTLVNGDPHHYVTSCPDVAVPSGHAFPTTLSYAGPRVNEEIVLDAAGNVVRESWTTNASWYTAGDTLTNGLTTSYTYDPQGELTGHTSVDNNGDVQGESVVDQRDSEGRIVAMTATLQPITIHGITYQGTAHARTELRYGPVDGRLAEIIHSFQPSGNVYYDRAIVYDDAALRRDFFTTVDLHGDVPTAGGAGHAISYEVVDENGHIIEFMNQASEVDPQSFLDVRYDDDGRVVTAISTYLGQTATASYIYDCP
jgi:YD repeat-containing protein